MRYMNAKFFLVGLCSLALTATAFAATKGRIMTNGKITMYQNGQAVASYTDQGPLDENSLIGCDGTCMIKMQGIAMNAVDQTMFAVKEQDNSVSLYVQKGKIYFAISDLSHQFAFYTPDGYFVKSEGFVSQASAGSSVKGFVQVTDEATEIGMDTGSMIVTTDDGTKTINPGQSIVLAMVDVPPAGEQEGNNPRGGTAFWGGLSGSKKVEIVTLGAAGAAAGIAYLNFQDSDKKSAFAAREGFKGTTPPASPNR